MIQVVSKCLCNSGGNVGGHAEENQHWPRIAAFRQFGCGCCVSEGKMITGIVAHCLCLIEEVYGMLTFEKVKRGLCLRAAQWGLGEFHGSLGGLRGALYWLELSDGAIKTRLERWGSFLEFSRQEVLRWAQNISWCVGGDLLLLAY